jgi:hypothetical protein
MEARPAYRRPLHPSRKAPDGGGEAMDGYGAAPDRYILALDPSREPLNPYSRSLDESRSLQPRGRGVLYLSVETLDAFRASQPRYGKAPNRYIEALDRIEAA